jgi:hypothetical protein
LPAASRRESPVPSLATVPVCSVSLVDMSVFRFYYKGYLYKLE